MCGRDRLPFDKVAADLSFVGAWRSWPYSSRFPQVTTDVSKGLDGGRAMTRAGERKRVWNLYWDTSDGGLAIYPRSQWADGEIAADEVAASIDGDVPRRRLAAVGRGVSEALRWLTDPAASCYAALALLELRDEVPSRSRWRTTTPSATRGDRSQHGAART
jgi:hypothetical protein